MLDDKTIKKYIENYFQYTDIFDDCTEIDWIQISRYQYISEPFMEKFQDKIDWYRISIYQKLSEYFMTKFQNQINWEYISHYQSLSEPFIVKFQNELNWDWISHYQSLSEPFITKFQDKVNWILLLNKYDFSDEFLILNAMYVIKSDSHKAMKKLQIAQYNAQFYPHKNFFNIELY
jgi:hypothetical protein